MEKAFRFISDAESIFPAVVCAFAVFIQQQSIEIMKLIFISAMPALEYVANLLFHLSLMVPNDIIIR